MKTLEIIAVLLSFLIVICTIIAAFKILHSLQKKTFRVKYIVTVINLDTGESLIAGSFKNVTAKTSEEAIEKVRQELSIQTDRESMDLGVSLRAYSNFHATEI